MSDLNETENANPVADLNLTPDEKPRGKPGPRPGSRAEKARLAAEEAAKATGTPPSGAAADAGVETVQAEAGADLGTLDLVATQPNRGSTGGVDVGVFLKDPSVVAPEYKTSAAAAMDVRAHFAPDTKVEAFSSANRPYSITPRVDPTGKVSILVPPGSRVKMPTGLIFDIPDGYKISVFARSGLSLKDGISLANGVAVIDSDYTDETFILVVNTSDARVEIASGDRVAQVAVEKVERMNLNVIAEAPGRKGDRVGGLGSTKVA